MNNHYNHLDDYLDDRVVISDEVKAMSKEELDAEIARLEKEIRDKKAESARKIS